MSRNAIVVNASLQRLLTSLGDNIKIARLRRRFSMELVAERAGIARTTLYAIERGEPSVAIGSYANVLQCLGLERNIDAIARDDELGRKLQDASLTTPKRAPQRRLFIAIKKSPRLKSGSASGETE